MSAKTKTGWRFWPFAGICAVTAMWGVSASANWWAGYSLADDELIAFVLGGASIASDIMKAVALFVVVAALGNRQWIVALTALVVFLACAAWSLRSATYFSAHMMTQHVAERESKIKQRAGKAELLDIAKKRASFLAQQDLKIDPNTGRNARETLVAERRRTSEEYELAMGQAREAEAELRATEVVANADPLAALFNVNDRDVVLATSLFFACLLELVSGVGFWIIAASRQARVRDLKEVGFGASPYASKGPGGPGGGGGGSVIVQAQPQPQLTGPATIRAEAKEPTNIVRLARPTTVNRSSLAEQVHDVVGDLLEPADDGYRILLSQVVKLVNDKLPRHRRLNKQQVSALLVPVALGVNRPVARKDRVAGQVWLYGVRVRDSVIAQARA
jgi:hypothetical protein